MDTVNIPKTAGLVLWVSLCAYAVCTPNTYHILDTVNLIFHEAGHTVFSFLGEFVHVLMGSAFQVLVPLACAFHFYTQGDRYATGLMFIWSGESMGGVAHYAADAQVMALELLGGDDVIHDWNYLLGQTGLLPWTWGISVGLYVLAGVLMAYGCARSLQSCLSGQSGKVV